VSEEFVFIDQTRWRLRLQRAKGRPQATPPVPYGKHPYVVAARNVVDMVASALEQNPTRPRHWRSSIRPADMRRVADHVERCGQFFGKKVGRSETIPTPPVVNGEDLGVRFRSGSDRQGHRRRRSSSRISDAGRR
jgi:hypothetical protein